MRLAALLAAGLMSACLLAAPAALAAAPCAEMLTYMPTELIYSAHTAAQVDEVLGSLGSYDIGQALLQMPRFNRKGAMKLKGAEPQMLPQWISRAAVYSSGHGGGIGIVAVFNAALGAHGPDLEVPAVRASMIAAILPVAAMGVAGVQLDVEPFPESPGFTSLLEELDAALARQGYAGRISVVAPAETGTWKPAYLLAVSRLVDQIDPTYYESELPQARAYEEWVSGSLAYYSANTALAARIIPVLPSYRSNRWHSDVVEDIATATTGVREALAAGSRVNGAGIWWWFGFYDREGGRFPEALAAADRAAWLSSTLTLQFSG